MTEIYNKESGKIEDTIFVDQFNTVKKFKDLLNCKLNEKIYYNPSFFPYLSKNVNDGCIFQNYTIPSAHYSFNGQTINEIESNLSLENYITQYDQLIKQKITDIFSSYDKIVLSFSGGIDSLVLLSYIDKLNFLNKTKIVYYENYFVDEHPDLIRNNKIKQNALQDIEKTFKENFLKIKIDITDWLSCANNKNYTHLKMYGISTILEKFPNHFIISGHQGDKTLLHDTIWIDQLLIKDNSNFTKLKNLLKDDNLYMNNFLSYDFSKTLIPLKNLTLHMRHWNDFGSMFYNPLGTDARLCRKIKLESLSLEDILDARVARELIYRNVGKKYNNFITKQGNFDGDNYSKKSFSKKLLNLNILEIPHNLNHDKNGLNWLNDELNRDIIDTNTITSVKNLKNLSEIKTQCAD